jgi:hypothetical protein
VDLRAQIINDLANHLAGNPADWGHPLTEVVIHAIDATDRPSAVEQVKRHARVRPGDFGPQVTGRISQKKRDAICKAIGAFIAANPWCYIGAIRDHLAERKLLPARNLLRNIMVELREAGDLVVDDQAGVKRLRYRSAYQRGSAPKP